MRLTRRSGGSDRRHHDSQPWRAAIGAAALGLALAHAHAARAQAPGLGASVELVDPNSFRVCADPRNLPFSDEAGEGFENKIAALFAQDLGKKLSYVWFPQVMGFYRMTLNANRCDVVMGVAEGDEMVQNTSPYYTSVYALVFKPGSGLDGATSLEDARLKQKRIGIVAGTPPATIMVADDLLDRAKSYPLSIDTRHDSSSQAMLHDIEDGTIDAGVLWGPIAGYYAKEAKQRLAVVPLVHEKSTPLAPMKFRITMGVRHSDQAWKRTLNRLIAEDQGKIDAILADYGVPVVDSGNQAVVK